MSLPDESDDTWAVWPKSVTTKSSSAPHHRWTSTDSSVTTFCGRDRNVADIRVNLLAKEHRVQQSHEILLRIRDEVTQLAESMGANIKLVEVPPGPPVLSTITAEVYGPPEGNYAQQIEVARSVERSTGTRTRRGRPGR